MAGKKPAHFTRPEAQIVEPKTGYLTIEGKNLLDALAAVIERTGGVTFDRMYLPVYAKASLPSASVAGAMIYVTDDVGGATPAFADGTNWRRTADRNVIS